MDLIKLSNSAIAGAQVWLFAIALAGFIGLLYVLILGGAQLDETSEKLAYTMLGVLGTIVTQMSGYFYSRQRPDAPQSDTTQAQPQRPAGGTNDEQTPTH